MKKIGTTFEVFFSSQGDLAGRNVLLSHDLKAKVADFGLCTRLYEHDPVKKEARPGMFPFRSAALEVLLTEIPFMELSDVWSFGVLMWEIFHLGSAIPYNVLLGRKKIVEFLLNGHRLSKPELCPQYIYDIMLECWQERHSLRPTFLQLKSQLEIFLAPSSQLPSNQKSREERYSGTPHCSRKDRASFSSQ